MQNIFGAQSRAALQDFLGTSPLLAFDFDGTLCPIVDRPDHAQLEPETRALCRELCRFSPCVLLTGRARANVLPRVDGVGFVEVVGNHGAEWSDARPGDERRRRQIAEWKELCERGLLGARGVEIEDKGLSLTIHYREAVSRTQALDRIEGLLKRISGARIVGGKEVFNLLTPDELGKGQALLDLMHEFGRKTAVYLGDDVTDEDVFTLPASTDVFKVRVGYSEHSAAQYFVPSQSDVNTLLRLLRSPSEAAA